jgi:hypothetical protein
MTRPIPEGFKHRLLLELAEQIPEQAGGHLAARPAVLSSGPRSPMWRRRPFLAGAGAVAAAGVIAGALAAGAASPPMAKAHGQTPFTTAAWTVTTKPDGSVVVTIRDTRDPAGLQAKLRAAEVPAVVRVASPSCGTFGGATQETYSALTETYSQYLKGWLFVVHPDGIQPGHTLTILIQRYPNGQPGGQLEVTSGVVATSHPQCRPDPGQPALPAPTATAPSDVPSSAVPSSS